MIRALRSIILVSICFLSLHGFAQSDFDAYKQRHGYYLTKLPSDAQKEELQEMQTLTSLPDDLQELELPFHEEDHQYFKISGSDQMLVVKSLEFLRKEYELNRLER